VRGANFGASETGVAFSMEDLDPANIRRVTGRIVGATTDFGWPTGSIKQRNFVVDVQVGPVLTKRNGRWTLLAGPEAPH
jgi:hypothetical protein